jgi:3',5'-cyclic AMP phosphodiesterase CpdA
MRLAFIGDIHLYRLWVAPWRLLSKRLLGQANLWLRRRFKFDHRTLEPLLARVASIKPDWILFTGDLTTTALEEEFADFRQRCGGLLERFPSIILPGNHDLYTRAAARGRLIYRYFPDQVPQPMPQLRPLSDRWSLLAVDAVRVRRLTARGRVGPEQIAAVRRLLGDMAPDQNLIVLCHYPAVLPGGARDKAGHGLEDAAALQEVLRPVRGNVLYLHGHIHTPWYWSARGTGWDNLTTVNAGAPCKIAPPMAAGQGFWQIDLHDNAAQAFQLLHHVPLSPAAGANTSDARLAPEWTTKAYPESK